LLSSPKRVVVGPRSAIESQTPFGIEKTSFASNASGDLSGQAPNPRLVARRADDRDLTTDGGTGRNVQIRLCVVSRRAGLSKPTPISPSGLRPNALPLHDVRYLSAKASIGRRANESLPPASWPRLTPGARAFKQRSRRNGSNLHRKDIGAGPSGDRSPPLKARLRHANGGARRDRTDDLMLAKHALSQLSYGPGTTIGHPVTGHRKDAPNPRRFPIADGGPGRT
jgi:hypothetical protein